MREWAVSLLTGEVELNHTPVIRDPTLAETLRATCKHVVEDPLELGDLLGHHGTDVAVFTFDSSLVHERQAAVVAQFAKIADLFADTDLITVGYDFNLLGSHPRLGMELPQLYLKSSKAKLDKDGGPLIPFDHSKEMPTLEMLAKFITTNAGSRSIRKKDTDNLDFKYNVIQQAKQFKE